MSETVWRKEVDLKDWGEKRAALLNVNKCQVLLGASKMSHKQIVTQTQKEYEQFTVQRRAGSADEGGWVELDHEVKRLTNRNGGRDAA